MTSNVKKTVKNKKKKMKKADIILIVGGCLIALPFLVLGWFLISAAMDTGTPILGDRYVGNLDPAITSAQVSEVKENVKAIDGVEEADAKLATATLRVYLDIEDNASAENAKEVASQAYDKITGVLDVNTYFSQANGMKMYDLEIHVYNQMDDVESESFVYVIEEKTSKMEAPSQQVVSEPLYPELAEQLRQDVIDRNNPQASEDSSDITVGQGELEESAPSTEETTE